ncbi:MAG: putative secreted hydrolase, partial [Candidatus Binatia bacterium]
EIGRRASLMLSVIRSYVMAGNVAVVMAKVTDHTTGAFALSESGQLFDSIYTERSSPVKFALEYTTPFMNDLVGMPGSWRIQGRPGRYQVQVRSFEMTAAPLDLDLSFKGTGPAQLLSHDGIVHYGDDHELAYYVRPKMAVSGTMRFDGKPVAVKGQGWFERQWGAWPQKTFGWKYLNIHLDGGEQWLLFTTVFGEHRKEYAARFPATGGIQEPPPSSWEMTDFSLAGRPCGSMIRVDSDVSDGGPLELRVEPLFPDEGNLVSQYPGVPTIWESACKVEGTRAGKRVTGWAMTEMNNYV